MKNISDFSFVDGLLSVRRGRGKTILQEAKAARWLGKDELYRVDWLSTDLGLIDKLKNTFEIRENG